MALKTIISKKAEPTIAMAVIQAIGVRWSKASRGGDRATLRNRVPDAVKAAVQDAPDSSLLFQRIYFDETNAFIAPSNEFVEVKDLTKLYRFGCVTVFPYSDSLRAVYEHTREGGAPDRFGRFEIELEPDQWGRFQYNGRFRDFDGGSWWYEKWTFNVGFFRHLFPGIFLKQEPVKSYSQMELLF